MHEKEFEIVYNDVSLRDSSISRRSDNKPARMELFPYIPFLNSHDLFSAFSRIDRYTKFVQGDIKDTLFVDIGSGSGRILKLALEFGFGNVKGIELLEDIATAGAKEFNLNMNDILIGDAFDLFNSSLVRDYNFVVAYTYRPIVCQTTMEKLHLHIMHSLERIEFAFALEMYPTYYPVNYIRKDFPYTLIPNKYYNVGIIK